jgi:MATE family multidrug resistance protein
MNKKILNLAFPNIISNITVPLLGMVDLAIVGHLESEKYIGAIALGGILFNFIYWGFGFLRMGTSGFTAQAYGARDLQETVITLGRALTVGFLGAALVIILQVPIEKICFLIINGSPEVESLAVEYYYIRIWAAPATIGMYALTGWFIGMQNARFPMIISIVVNLINVVVSYILVYYGGMKSDGVALGTVIAQYLGLILGGILFVRYYGRLYKYWSIKLFKKAEPFRRFMVVNRDILIRTLLLIFVFSFFTAVSAESGDAQLAINTLLLQFFMLFSYLIDGFAYAAEALVGRYTGSKDSTLLKKSVQHLFLWGLGISIPFSLVYLIAGNRLLYLLTSQVDVIALAAPYLFWVGIIPLISFPAFLWDGIYIGATASRGMRNSMLISVLVVFIPTYYISSGIIENHALWFSLTIFLIARGITQSLMAKKEIFRD